MADKVCLHRAECSFSRLSTTAHFAKPDQTLISLNFNDGTNEPSPVTAICMSQRRLQWHSYGRGSDVSDLHCLVRNLRASEESIFHFSFDISHLPLTEFLFVSVRVTSWIVLHRFSHKTLHEVTRSIAN